MENINVIEYIESLMDNGMSEEDASCCASILLDNWGEE